MSWKQDENSLKHPGLFCMHSLSPPPHSTLPCPLLLTPPYLVPSSSLTLPVPSSSLHPTLSPPPHSTLPCPLLLTPPYLVPSSSLHPTLSPPPHSTLPCPLLLTPPYLVCSCRLVFVEDSNNMAARVLQKCGCCPFYQGGSVWKWYGTKYK